MDKIAIIGGGIGGLTLANCFQQQGIPFHLYERAEAFGEVGAGIGISESAIGILSRLGLKEAVISNGKFIKDAVIVDKHKKVIRKLPIENGGICLHRSTLIDALAANINQENVSFEHEVSGIEVKAEYTELQFSNGIIKRYSSVIACDGINSLIRKKLLPKVEKRYSGQTVWRGIANIELPEDFQKVYYEFWGENKRFATIPLNENQYYWYAVKCAEAGAKDNPQTLKAELKELFKNYCSVVPQVIDYTPEIIRNDMWDIMPTNTDWHYKNIIFLGDAIHATTPNLAQGGCQAIEDAYTLSRIVKKYGLTEQAAKYFKDLRVKKVNYIVNQSWKYGKTSHSSNSTTEAFIKFVFRCIPNNYFKKQYSKLIDLRYFESI